MPGPVFVLDAQGTPLMPMGAAHARTLLARRTAKRVPHHAFTIVQLIRSYTYPIVRPVLLHITLYWRTTTLLLLTEQRRGVVPLLMLLMERRRAEWIHHIYPYHRHTYVDRTNATVHRPKLHNCLVHSDSISGGHLSQVIASLRTLMPISHIIVDIADPQQHVLPIFVDDVTLSSLQLTVLSSPIHTRTLSPLLAATIDVARHSNWRFIPQFYASTTYARAEDTAHTTVSTIASRRVIRSMVAIPDDLLVIRHDGQHLQMGLYAWWRNSYSPRILMPTAADPTHVIWKWEDVSRISSLWSLPNDGVIFLSMR